MNAPSIFSRILLVTGALAVIGLTYWFIATSLAPVPVPPSASRRTGVHFDPSADVTKKPHFSELRLLGPSEVVPANLGRQNPFVPVLPAVSVLSVPTSTSLTTSTVTAVRATTTAAPDLFPGASPLFP